MDFGEINVWGTRKAYSAHVEKLKHFFAINTEKCIVLFLWCLSIPKTTASEPNWQWF